MNPLRLARTVIGVGLTLLIADVRAQQPPVTVPTSKNVSSAAELAGLWKAQQWFGPYARGQLLIERTPAGWIADFAGRSLPVQARASELSFELAMRYG